MTTVTSNLGRWTGRSESPRALVRAPSGRYTVGILAPTVGDREDAIRLLNVDYQGTWSELAAAVGYTPEHMWLIGEREDEAGKGNPVWRQFWATKVLPLYGEWTRFLREELGEDYAATSPRVSDRYVAWTNRFLLHWEAIDAWRSRLVELRAAAGALGFKLTGPEPAATPTTFVDDALAAASGAAKRAANDAEGVLDVLKVALLGVVVIGGVVLASSIASRTSVTASTGGST